MSPQTTLSACLTALAALLNQNATPNAEITRRTFFIVSAVQRLQRAFDWRVDTLSDTVSTDDEGLADISEFEFGAFPSFSYVGPGDQNFGYTLVAFDDLQLYGQGDRKYALIVNEDGEWEMHTTEPNTELTVVFYSSPDVSSTQTAPFTAMVIAKGALIYYRQAQDPEADVGPEEDQFRQEVEELMENQERRRPQKFAQTNRDRTGGGIGDTS